MVYVLDFGFGYWKKFVGDVIKNDWSGRSLCWGMCE